MKPKNFPARKLRRKLIADNDRYVVHESKSAQKELEEARQVRTKKRRGEG